MTAPPRKQRSVGRLIGVVGICAVVVVGFLLRTSTQSENTPRALMGTEALTAALTPDASLSIEAGNTDVIVVLGCTVRKDRMSVYGHDRETTPFLEALAAKGVRFERVFAQAPWTRPSMGAWVTGRWPRAHQLDNPKPVRLSNRALPPKATTLAERLAAEGYRTIGVVANPNLNSRFGFAQGFEVYDEPDKLWRDELDTVSGTDIVRSFMKAVDDTPEGQPIYGRLVFVDTHAPRSPQKRYQQRMGTTRPTRKGRRLASYDASMLQLDQLLADLFVGMHERDRNVLFVFAADHGEGLNVPKHHGVGHGNHLYPSTTAVPWLIHHPALSDPGRSIGGLAMGVDLHPTLLELLGLDTQPDLDGQSLADSVLGEVDSTGREFAYAETFFRKSHKSAVYGEEHYLIRDHALPSGDRSFTDSLFATTDWKARVDQRADAPDAYAELSDTLSAWESAMDSVQAAAGDPLEIDPRESTMKQLKALGYVD